MGVRFDDPVWLMLALAALPLGVAGLRWMRAMSRARAWSAVAMRLVVVALIAGLVVTKLDGTGPRGTPGFVSDAAEIPTTGESTMLLDPAPFGRVGRALQVAVVLACPVWCLLMPFLDRSGVRRRGRQPGPGASGFRARWLGREPGDRERSLPQVRTRRWTAPR